MARRRRYFFRRKRHSAPEVKNRPITMQSKVTCIISAVSVLIYFIGVNVAVITDGEIIKLFAGLGFCLLLIGIVLLVKSLRRIKKDDEPLYARVISAAASFVSILPWGYLYILGMIHE